MAAYGFHASLVAAFCDGLAEANRRTSRQLVALADTLAAGVNPAERRAAHEYLGRRAQQAVLHSYDQVVTAAEGAGSRMHYRADLSGRNHRYASGALRSALSSPEFFKATPDGLWLINRTVLNRDARQWARLNAGAGGLGQGSRRGFEVSASNLVLFVLDLDMGPRPGFSLPRGYWFDGGEEVAASAGRVGQDAFYPMGTGPSRGLSGARSRATGAVRSPRRITRGIQARNFLDAGLARLAADFVPTYKQMHDRLLPRGQLVSSRVTVVARPARVSSSVRVYARY